MLETDFLQDVRNRIAHGRSRRERKVDDAERNAKALRRLLSDELSDTRNLERGLLDRLAEGLEIRAAAGVLEDVVDDARTRDADVDDRIAFSDAMEGARHERIVVRRIAEDDELRAPERVAVLRPFGRLLDDLAHEAHGVHVDASLRRADVDGRAEALGRRHRLGDGANEHLIRRRHALRHDGRVTADEIDAELLCRTIKRLRDLHKVGRFPAAGRADDRRRRNRDALVDDRDAELAADLIPGLHQFLRKAHQLRIDVVTRLLQRRVRAVEERDAHRDGPDIEILLENHLVGFKNF